MDIQKGIQCVLVLSEFASSFSDYCFPQELVREVIALTYDQITLKICIKKQLESSSEIIQLFSWNFFLDRSVKEILSDIRKISHCVGEDFGLYCPQVCRFFCFSHS